MFTLRADSAGFWFYGFPEVAHPLRGVAESWRSVMWILRGLFIYLGTLFAVDRTDSANLDAYFLCCFLFGVPYGFGFG